MKRIFITLLAFTTIITFTGCFDTTEEITIHDHDGGVFSTTADMSAMVGMIKQMGTGADKPGMDKAIDTTFSMQDILSQDSSMTEGEKKLLQGGSMKMNMNLGEEKMIIRMDFPFTKTDDLNELKRIANKLMAEKMKMPESGEMQSIPGMEDLMKPSSMDDYYETGFSKGLIVKAVNKEKYAEAKNDAYLKSMQEAAAMGMTTTAKYIINLPRPATKAEGKSIKLSEDKKKVTVVATIAEFFADPANLEFRIEY